MDIFRDVLYSFVVHKFHVLLRSSGENCRLLSFRLPKPSKKSKKGRAVRGDFSTSGGAPLTDKKIHVLYETATTAFDGRIRDKCDKLALPVLNELTGKWEGGFEFDLFRLFFIGKLSKLKDGKGSHAQKQANNVLVLGGLVLSI